ncbi:hypothetical protein BKA83DRAFT_18677 [Pisolithus microcarpus]|nr:hypothetical protein BKA83DRAFT_18677 [Pisolithus microcarpus]
MARTKQMAGRTMSGYAKPAQLSGHKRHRSSSTEILTSRSSSPLSSCPPSPELQPMTISKESNTFCYLCHDGGRTFICSNSACPRVVCDICIDILESIATRLGNQEISFKCPACHEKEERAAHSKPMPYFAFTQIVQGKSVPACSMPTFVKGICERASKSQVRGGPILILHFVCTGLNTRGGIPRLLNAALEEYYTEATLPYLEVVFDFGTQHKLRHWQAEAQHLATTIGEDTFQQKIFFISVHSEVTRGDLFAGKDEGGMTWLYCPRRLFMDYLFAGRLQLLVSGATMFMLSCGPLVTFLQSICSFKEVLLELRPAYTITFGTTHFIGAVIKSFIVAFGGRVVIQGHDLGEVFTDLLNVSVKLPMHTDAYLFQVEEQMASGMPNPSSSAIHIKGMHYSWYHTHHRPWGCPLPMSCLKCSSIHSWSPSKQGKDSSGAPGRISTCQSPACSFQMFSYQPHSYQVIKVKVGEGMGWIKQAGI